MFPSFLSLICFFCFIPLSSAMVIKGEALFIARAVEDLTKVESEIIGIGGKLIDQKLTRGLGDEISGSISVDMKLLTTDMYLRDSHLHEKYLETEKYPKATLSIKQAKNGAFEGELTIKGETKPVKGSYSIDGGKIKASMTISLKDYPAVGSPSWLSVSIADSVEVEMYGAIE